MWLRNTLTFWSVFLCCICFICYCCKPKHQHFRWNVYESHFLKHKYVIKKITLIQKCKVIRSSTVRLKYENCRLGWEQLYKRYSKALTLISSVKLVRLLWQSHGLKRRYKQTKSENGLQPKRCHIENNFPRLSVWTAHTEEQKLLF